METMARKKSRPRRSFTPEFKAEIVELRQRGDRSVGQVARDFDLTETAVREWSGRPVDMHQPPPGSPPPRPGYLPPAHPSPPDTGTGRQGA